MRAERLYVLVLPVWREKGGGQKGWPAGLYDVVVSINTYYISTSKTRFLRSPFFLIFFTAPKDLTTHFATTRALEGFPSTAH